MLRLLARWLLVVVLSFSIGLPASFLQSAAWVGMIVSFSRETTLVKSIAMTFDGDHACHLCKAVERGESSGKKQNAWRAAVKMNLAEPPHEDFFLDQPATPASTWIVCGIGQMAFSPPVPPPRLA